MNAHSRRPEPGTDARQALANWLALLVLLALGIVWSPGNATEYCQIQPQAAASTRTR